MGLYDAPRGRGSETFMCESAAIMLRSRGVMVNFANLCHDTSRKIEGIEGDLFSRLTSEEARIGKIAEKAGQIVKTCTGCDGNGIRLEGVAQCPKETTARAREWWRELLSLRPLS